MHAIIHLLLNQSGSDCGKLRELSRCVQAPAARASADAWNAFEGADDGPAALLAAAADTNGTSWANFEAAPSQAQAADPVAVS